MSLLTQEANDNLAFFYLFVEQDFGNMILFFFLSALYLFGFVGGEGEMTIMLCMMLWQRLMESSHESDGLVNIFPSIAQLISSLWQRITSYDVMDFQQQFQVFSSSQLERTVID